VVSASRKTQHLGEVPASMHVITADDIRSSGARNLPEALRLVPGLDVAQLSGSRWGISTRGFTGRYANKLLVLVDGRSVYSPLYSGVIWEAERVPLDTIERIEVLHGPAGSVWGSNAVNGVINIITREAGETPGELVDVAIGDGGRRMLRARHGAEAGEGSAWRIGAMADEGGAGRHGDAHQAVARLVEELATVPGPERLGAAVGGGAVLVPLHAGRTGQGGGVGESNPEFAQWTAQERIAEAESTGAEKPRSTRAMGCFSRNAFSSSRGCAKSVP